MKNNKIEKIRKVLNTLDDIDFNHLFILLQTAKNARNLKDEFDISDESFCTDLNIPSSKLKSFLNGSHDYTVDDFARLEYMYVKYVKIKNGIKVQNYVDQNFAKINTDGK